jgi:hypothetical protein
MEKSVISWHKLSLEPYQNSFSVYFGAASRNIGRLYSDREQRSGDELGLHDQGWRAS